jgi:periplasmic protein TonB
VFAPDNPSLFQHPRFRRMLGWSAGWHFVFVLAVLFSPDSFYTPPPAPIYVELLAAAIEEPVAAPKQQVQDAVVIPREPPPKPKRQRPTPPDPEPPPPQKQPTPEELMAKLREKVKQPRERDPDEPIGQVGQLDPEKAAYQRKLQTCMYSNMVGMQPFRFNRKLQVVYDVKVQAGGALESVEKISASGERAVDEAAARAIQRCAPFDPPPGGPTDVRLVFRPGEMT